MRLSSSMRSWSKSSSTSNSVVYSRKFEAEDGRYQSSSGQHFAGIGAALILAASTILPLPLMASANTASLEITATGKIVAVPSNAEMLELTLPPGGRILSDAGTLIYMEDGVTIEREFRGGAGSRVLRSKIFVDCYTNTGRSGKDAQVGLATQFPGRIIPVNLQDVPGNTIIGNTHSFLAAPYSADLDFELDSLHGPQVLNFFRRERVTGTGTVYLTGSGNIISKKIGPSDTLKVTRGAWVAMTDGMELEYNRARDNVFSDSVLTIKGPGTVWIDTAPISRIANEIGQRLPPR